MIAIAICDVKSGRDEEAYDFIEKLESSQQVTPLLIGRLFESADAVLLLHCVDMESLDDYLMEKIRSNIDIQELVIVPIYEFKLLSSFDFMVDLELEVAETEQLVSEDFLLFMAKIDVAPTKDKAVYDYAESIQQTDENVPLMLGHTFHSEEFDLVLFFLSKNLERAWEFAKMLRAIDGVLDSEMNLVAHFEGLVTLEQFKELASTPRSSE